MRWWQLGRAGRGKGNVSKSGRGKGNVSKSGLLLLKSVCDPHKDLAQVLYQMPFLTQPWSPLTTQGLGFITMIPGCLSYTLS